MRSAISSEELKIAREPSVRAALRRCLPTYPSTHLGLSADRPDRGHFTHALKAHPANDLSVPHYLARDSWGFFASRPCVLLFRRSPRPQALRRQPQNSLHRCEQERVDIGVQYLTTGAGFYV